VAALRTQLSSMRPQIETSSQSAATRGQEAEATHVESQPPSSEPEFSVDDLHDIMDAVARRRREVAEAWAAAPDELAAQQSRVAAVLSLGLPPLEPLNMEQVRYPQKRMICSGVYSAAVKCIWPILDPGVSTRADSLPLSPLSASKIATPLTPETAYSWSPAQSGFESFRLQNAAQGESPFAGTCRASRSCLFGARALALVILWRWT
jgi:hypothetical protein